MLIYFSDHKIFFLYLFIYKYKFIKLKGHELAMFDSSLCKTLQMLINNYNEKKNVRSLKHNTKPDDEDIVFDLEEYLKNLKNLIPALKTTILYDRLSKTITGEMSL